MNLLNSTTNTFKRQFPRNSFYQVLAFCTQVVVGILLVPYLVKSIGTAAYGLIPIAGLLTQYVSLISQSISSAVNRFLIIALQQENLDEANRIFNTAFFSYFALALLQLPVLILAICYAGSIITIPDDLFKDAILLLSCSAVTFFVNIVSSVFSVTLYANNRLDILRSIDIGRQISRLVGIVTLFMVFGPALRFVGYVDVTISLVVFVAQVIISKHISPGLKLSIHSYDWGKIRQLLGMGGWLLINNVGILLFLRIDIWVCNRFVSPEAAGEYAAVLQWTTLLRHGGVIISAIVTPMIMIYYARSEIDNVLRLSTLSVRVLSLVIAVPIGVLCIFSSSFLDIWLGPAFTHLAPLMIITLCHLVINSGVQPLFSISIAMNKVRLPALMTLFMGTLNFILAIFFVTYFDWGIYGIAMAGAIVLTGKNALFTPLYAAKLLKAPWHTFIKPYMPGLGLLIALILSGNALRSYFINVSWFYLILIPLCLVISAIGLFAAWILLPKTDRRLLQSLLPGNLGRLKTKTVEA